MARLGPRPAPRRRPARGSFLPGDGARGDHRLPPAAHPPQLHCGTGAAGRAGYRGVDELRGEVIGWVAIHRRHHAFTDRPGDPHSPYRYGSSLLGQLRGLAHAHVGWLLRDDPTPVARYAPDMAADPAMRAISAAFPALCAMSLGLPFGVGWALGGWHAALTALLWAGLVRVTLLQHVTWSVNSLCHVIGTRPFATRRYDRATNLWPLALLSLGESWHNMHHSDPACARHGADPGQVDVSAAVIRVFERLGWATSVHWPVPARLDSRRRDQDRPQAAPVLEGSEAPTSPAPRLTVNTDPSLGRLDVPDGPAGAGRGEGDREDDDRQGGAAGADDGPPDGDGDGDRAGGQGPDPRGSSGRGGGLPGSVAA